MNQLLQSDFVNLMLAAIIAFTGTSIGGIVWRFILRKFTTQIELGVSNLEKRNKISSDTVASIAKAVNKFEEVVSDKLNNLITSAEKQNSKIAEYRELIDYQINRDNYISNLLEKLLLDLEKEGD